MDIKKSEVKTVGALGVIALLAAMVVPVMALAVTLDEFTQDELDNNWVADRQFPSGDVESVTFGGRDNVAAIGVVGEDRSTQGSFYYFEGIKKVDDFGGVVEVDLYVPGEWEEAETSPLHVGFWSADSQINNQITAYPLIVYRNGENVNAGFYVYNTETGAYLESGVEVKYDDWNTLSISLDPENEEVNYGVNGESAGSSYAGNAGIGQVFLNHYNDGELDYTAYWHVGKELLHSLNGGGQIVTEELTPGETNGKGKNSSEYKISFGTEVDHYNIGAEGELTVRFHNVSKDSLDKTTFVAKEITEFNYFAGNNVVCEAAMNMTAVGTLNGVDGYSLRFVSGDSDDTLRVILTGNGMVYDSYTDFPGSLNCVGTHRTELDRGNITISSIY